MRFSVLMPVYNVDKYIVNSIESVQNQCYSDWELIIIDDGSTDDSGNICDKFAACDSRINVFHKSNGGLLSARRFAISLAKGDYCIFLDSDDFLERDCLSKISDVVSKYKADIVIYSAFKYFDGTGEKEPLKLLKNERGFIDKENIYEIILSSHMLNQIWTKSIRTEIIIGDPTDYSVYYNNSYGEDKLQFLYPLTKADSIVWVPEELYNYRINDSSMIHNMNLSTIDKRLHLHVWDCVYKYMCLWKMENPENIEKLSIYCISHMITIFDNMCYACQNKKELLKCINFEWASYLPEWAKRHTNSRLLSARSKIKLYVMRSHVYWIMALSMCLKKRNIG